MKKFILLFLLTSILYINTPAQTTLAVGDASILWYSAVGTDDFGFVTFVDLSVNTRIYFTDNGSSPMGVFESDEVVFEYLVTTTLSAGSIVQLNDNTNGTWSQMGSLGFASSGDQLFIFQDGDGVGGNLPENNPVFIMGLNAASQDKADSCDETDLNQTDSPFVLTPVTYGDGTGTFLAIGTGIGCQDELDFAYFNGGNDFGSIMAAEDEVLDPDNWAGEGGGSVTNTSAAYNSSVAAFTSGSNSILPVEWLSFKARVERSDVLLNWQTATEINNEKFVIEYSQDARYFQAIGEVAGRGFSNELAHYQFVHPNPQSGIHYYRLKQIDFDGEFEYSKIVSVVIDRENSVAIKLWPNPSSDGNVQLELYGSNQQDDCIVQLFNSNGQLVHQVALPLEKGENRLSFDWSHFSTGIYFVKLHVGNESLYHKIHLQH